MAGTNAGSAFVFVYLACIAGIGLPLLIAETMLERADKAIRWMRWVTAGVSRHWKAVGLIGICGALLILSFYSVVAGWILEYMIPAFHGFEGITSESAAQGFSSLLANPQSLIFWHTVFMIMTTAIVPRGVTSGIEKADKILMPALFFIILLLLAYGIFAADMLGAIDFMFSFDLSKINRTVIFSAMGHLSEIVH